MNASGILSAVLVLAGALIMAASLLQGRSIKREVSRSLAGTWGVIMALLVFFLAGYLLFAYLLLSGTAFPLELITGIVFFGGACYVFLVMKVSRSTFQDLRSEFHDRLEAEEELRRSEERFRTIVEALPDMMFRISRDGTFLDHLGAPGLTTLRPPPEFLGRKMSEVLPPDVAERAALHLERALATPAVQVFEYSLPGPRGTVDYEARMVRCGDGEVISLVRDVTSRRRAERALEVAKEDLELQNKELRKLDRMKDALISDVSHELKTPVAKHVMQLEILRRSLEGTEVPSKVREIIEVMEAGLHRQQTVIRNIMMISSLEAGGRTPGVEPVRLDRVIEEVLKDYGHTMETLGIEVKRELQAVTVEADGEMLWNVFSNLVDNAIKYRGKTAPRIGISMKSGGGEAVVRVADNGVGFPPGEAGKVFERFYRTSAAVPGIGLGLSIARLIVERFGGRIGIESQGRDRGATVTVALPIALAADSDL